jgi:hypothetical protein
MSRDLIKPINVSLRLDDEEKSGLATLAGRNGLNVSELLENFIADLVGSNYRNGSDEQDLASAWFDRCGFSFFQNKTLTAYLCDYMGYSMREFVDVWESLQDLKSGLAETRQRIANIEEDYRNYTRAFKTIADYNAYLLDDLNTMQEELADADQALKAIEEDFAEYKNGETYDWEKECAAFMDWYKMNVEPY